MNDTEAIDALVALAPAKLIWQHRPAIAMHESQRVNEDENYSHYYLIEDNTGFTSLVFRCHYIKQPKGFIEDCPEVSSPAYGSLGIAKQSCEKHLATEEW